MAQFDPSVIKDIGTSAQVDPAGAQAKALTLADLYQRNELGKMDVAAKKTEQGDMAAARDILSKSDLTTQEGQDKAIEAVTKRSPQLGMALMKDFQSQRAGKADLDRAQLELYNAKNDIIGGALVGLKEQHDGLIRAGKSEAEVNAAMMPQVIQTVQGLVQAKLPDGKPVLNDQDRQWISTNLAKGYNPQAIDQLVQRSQQAKAALASKLAERKQDLADTREARESRNTASQIEDREAKARDRAEGKMSDDDVVFTAGQYLAGDKSVMQGIGRGTQGAGNIVKLRREIRQQAEEAGLKPADVAARMAEFNGYVAEQRALGTRLANIQTSANEALKMINVARKASAAVPRGTFQPWNKLQQMGEASISDPKLKALKLAIIAVTNTWARAISPSGTPTVFDKQHIDSVLGAADSAEALNAGFDQLQTEVETALEAPVETREQLHQAFLKGSALPPKSSPAPAAPAPGTPPPQQGAAPPGAGGTTAPPPPPGFVIQGG